MSYNHTFIHQPDRDSIKEIKAQALKYIHCPKCESQAVVKNGKSKSEVKKYRCKEGGLQFVN